VIFFVILKFEDRRNPVLFFYVKFLQIHNLRVPYVFWTEGNKEFLVISSDSFQIVDEGMKKILLGLVMSDFSTQMYVERKI